MATYNRTTQLFQHSYTSLNFVWWHRIPHFRCDFMDKSILSVLLAESRAFVLLGMMLRNLHTILKHFWICGECGKTNKVEMEKAFYRCCWYFPSIFISVLIHHVPCGFHIALCIKQMDISTDCCSSSAMLSFSISSFPIRWRNEGIIKMEH